MEFCKNAVLLYQQEQLEKFLIQKEHFTKKKLEEDYRNYQERIYTEINKNPVKFDSTFVFFNEKLFAYFCNRFVLDKFDIDTHIDREENKFFIIVEWNRCK